MELIILSLSLSLSPVAIFERFQTKVYDYRPVHEAIDDRQPVGLSNLRV